MRVLDWILHLTIILSVAARRTRRPPEPGSSSSTLFSRVTEDLIRLFDKEYRLSPLIVKRLHSLGMSWQIRSNSWQSEEMLRDEDGHIDWDEFKRNIKLK